jgi:hypothetical protein
MTGIANRQFMTDGTVGKGNKIQDGYEGQIIGLQSVKGSIKDWFWSTLVGGYSHVSTVDSEGNLVQYGGKAYSMKGRGYEIIGYDEGLNLTATRLHPKVVGDNNYYYNTNTNNCSTTLSTGFSIPSQWTPYNIYSYYNYPQFGYWYH